MHSVHSGRGAALVREALDRKSREDDFPTARMADLLSELAAVTTVSVIYTRGSWLDIDTIVDLTQASAMK